MPACAKHTLIKLDGLLPEWLRRLIRNREWQKSSGISAAIWVLNTLLIYRLVSELGHGWQFNLAVSLAADAVMYGFNKSWIWRKRKAAVSTSVSW